MTAIIFRADTHRGLPAPWELCGVLAPVTSGVHAYNTRVILLSKPVTIVPAESEHQTQCRSACASWVPSPLAVDSEMDKFMCHKQLSPFDLVPQP